jgi:hypothetical protein
MIGFLIATLVIMIIAYTLYRRYFFHKTPSIHSPKPHFTLKIDHD